LPILYCALELYLPYCHSLKEKRRVIRSTADKLRTKFKMSVGELDYQDTWQRSLLGAVAIASSRVVLEQMSSKVMQESEKILGGDLADFYYDIIEHH
jgi:uncharacterized protein YlxP (DUF503 family)